MEAQTTVGAHRDDTPARPASPAARQPRRIRPRRAYYIQRVACTGGTLLLLALAAWILTGRVRDAQALADHGVVTQAMVTEAIANHSRGTSFVVVYDFTDRAGRSHHITADADRDTYMAAEPGRPLTITYLPELPTLTRPFKVGPGYVAFAKSHRLWDVVFFALLAAAFTFFSEQDLAFQRRLGQYGELATGTVTRRGRVSTQGGTQLHLTYVYTDASGGEHERTLTVGPKVYNAHPEGSTIAVMYDPERPGRTTPVETMRVGIV